MRNLLLFWHGSSAKKMKLSDPLQPGEVALIGAGPGDPDLVTIAARKLLADCDVIIHDALVSEAVLAMGAADASRVFAGKRGGRPSASQQDICKKMIDLAKLGNRIVRLKGGDPFIFGRGGEEIRALASARIPFRIIPGITSGLAAPAMAGIPLSDRTVNSSLAFLTGHEAGTKSRINWPSLVAAFPVIVLYMGAKSMPHIAAQLLASGMAAKTPVAIIHAATLPDEEIVTGTLDDAASLKLEAKSPSIVVIGEVVARRIAWR
jgi:uroporphyrin-III C-methyltransferase